MLNWRSALGVGVLTFIKHLFGAAWTFLRYCDFSPQYFDHSFNAVIFRWRDKCPWAPTWWPCRDPPTTAPARPLTSPLCTQKPSWWAYTCIHMEIHIHVRTHTHKHTPTPTRRDTECCNSLFHWAVPAELHGLVGLCGFHHVVCNQSCV